MERTFSISQSVKSAWEIFKKNPWFLIGTVIFVMAVSWLVSFAISYVDNGILRILLNLASMVLTIILTIGMLNVFLRAARGDELIWANWFDSSDRFVNYFIASILYNIIVLVGLVLLIIPGIYWALKYQFYKFAIIEDEDCGIIESFRRSAAATRQVKWKLFAFWFVTLGIALLGLIALGVGLFVAIPVIGVANAIIYLTLRGSFEEIVYTEETVVIAESPADPVEESEEK